MKTKFIVALDKPELVTDKEMKEYIRIAVSMWCKGLDPEYDPLFDLKESSVKVKKYKEQKQEEK